MPCVTQAAPANGDDDGSDVEMVEEKSFEDILADKRAAAEATGNLVDLTVQTELRDRLLGEVGYMSTHMLLCIVHTCLRLHTYANGAARPTTWRGGMRWAF